MKPYFFNDFAQISTSVLRLQNIIAFLQSLPSFSIKSLRILRFSVPSRSFRVALKSITLCLMFSEADACRAISKRKGADKKVLVNLSISVAIVAEKNSV